MATFIHAFAEGDKLAYHGTAEDDGTSRGVNMCPRVESKSSSEDSYVVARPRTEAIFRFNCFNVEDSHDPSVGLEYGELAIPGKMLKTEVFDPIIGACTIENRFRSILLLFRQ